MYVALLNNDYVLFIFKYILKNNQQINMALSVPQQHLFSYFNLVHVVPVKRLYELYEEIVIAEEGDKPPNIERLYREISLINRIIQSYDLEIVASVDELTSEQLFILVNTADNSVTQKSKFYDKSTTQFFAKIVQECILSDEGRLSETYCLNLSSKVGISKNTAQMLLEKFTKDKWIISKDGTISLGMRSVVELEQNIKQHYPDEIKYCPFCKLMIIQGYICKNCKLRSHYACLKKLVALSKSECVCPVCKAVWEDVPSVLQLIKDDTEVKSEDELTPPDPVPVKRKKKNLETD